MLEKQKSRLQDRWYGFVDKRHNKKKDEPGASAPSSDKEKPWAKRDDKLEQELFQNPNTGINFDQYDDIPVSARFVTSKEKKNYNSN